MRPGITRAPQSARTARRRDVAFGCAVVAMLCGIAVASITATPAPRQPPAQQGSAKPTGDKPSPKTPDFTRDDTDEDKQPSPPPQKKPDFNIDLTADGDDEEVIGTAAKQQRTGKPKFVLDAEPENDPDNPALRKAYAGVGECVRCHEKQAKTYLGGAHGRGWDKRTPAAGTACETCHGPGLAHDRNPITKGLIVNFKTTAPREVNKTCLTCHNKKEHADWQGSMHNVRNVSCVGCHSMHDAKSDHGFLKQASVVATCATCHRNNAAKMQRASHMPIREGKMDCVTCHNPHGSKNVRLLRVGTTVNESCASCHAEKRGPFLWEHKPIRESCVTCHDSHGSSNDRMLVTKAPMLCQRCHNNTISGHQSAVYDGTALVNRVNRLVGRGCPTCHSALHGSNHPSGRYFQR